MINNSVDRFDSIECAGWIYDSEDTSKPVNVILKVNDLIKHRDIANLYRKDVELAYGHGHAGFSFGIANFLDDGKNKVEVFYVLENSDDEFILAQGTFDSADARNMVEVGRDKWLFLNNDLTSNPDPAIELSVDLEDNFKTTQKTLRKRRIIFKQKNIRYVEIILPDKSIAKSEKRIQQHFASDRRPALLLAEKSNIEKLLYPIKTLNEDKKFLKTDTHLSQTGMLSIFSEIIEELGESFTTKLGKQLIIKKAGDLGNKLHPPVEELIIEREILYETIALTDDATKNLEENKKLRGSKIYHESNAENDYSCLLVGTSTAYLMRELFFQKFKYVHFTWGNEIDLREIDNIKPTHYVGIFAERFISTAILDKEHD